MDEAKIGPHPDIERVRRAHLNDLENIPVFIALAAVYMCVVKPDPWTAKSMFYGFTASRIIHTVLYLNEFPGSARAVCTFAGVKTCVYMAGKEK